MEKTLVIIKPDAFSKGLVGKIIARYEAEGLLVSDAKVLIPSKTLLARHYEAHEGKPFFGALLDFMGSGPVMALVLSGDEAVERVRRINGATDPAKAGQKTLRALYGTDIQLNAVHGSESPAEAEREIALWFD